MKRVVSLLQKRAWPGLLLCMAMLSGCAAPPELVRQTRLDSVRPAAIEQIEKFQLSGRISAKYDGQGFFGNLRWQHTAQRDEILILSPLGQGVAQIEQHAGSVVLTTSEQQRYQAQDAETLTEQVLGWRLPLAGMRYWVLGRAAPGQADIQVDPSQRPTRLLQDGWEIDYLAYREADGLMLPQKLIMHRQDLEMKLIIDDWVID